LESTAFDWGRIIFCFGWLAVIFVVIGKAVILSVTRVVEKKWEE
jgi:hypothetical protein